MSILRFLIIALPAVLGVSFLSLARAAKVRPYPFLPIGFVLLLLVAGLEILLAFVAGGPSLVVKRVPMRVLALVAVGHGARASLRLRDEQTRQELDGDTISA